MKHPRAVLCPSPSRMGPELAGAKTVWQGWINAFGHLATAPAAPSTSPAASFMGFPWGALAELDPEAAADTDSSKPEADPQPEPLPLQSREGVGGEGRE